MTDLERIRKLETAVRQSERYRRALLDDVRLTMTWQANAQPIVIDFAEWLDGPDAPQVEEGDPGHELLLRVRLMLADLGVVDERDSGDDPAG